jgi:hypothetical protein
MDKSLQDKAIDIKGKKYVLVADRILYFNAEYPNGTIKTILKSDPSAERVVMKAIVTPDVENPKRIFTGYSQALWGDGYINKTSAIENCETSAIGRALAMMGIGVVDSLASVDELNKAEIQSRMSLSPTQMNKISFALEDKNIFDPEEKRKIVKAITGGENLNTSGVARLVKEIENATEDTLQQLLKEEY